MKMYFEFESLLIILVILILWLKPKKLGLHSETVFYSLLFLGIISQLFNVIINIIAKYKIVLSTSAQSIVEGICFSALALFFYYDLMYMLTGLMSVKECEKKAFPLAAIPLIEIIVTILTPSKYEIGKGILKYTSLVYYLMLAFIVINTVLKLLFMILNYKKINNKIRIYMFFSIASYALGFVLEFVLGLSGTFSFLLALNLVILMINIENPFSNIDSEYKCFKQCTITPFLEEQYELEHEMFVVAVSFGYLSTDISIEKELVDLRKRIINEFYTVPEVKVFISSDHNIYAFSDEMALLEDFLRDTGEILDEFLSELKNSLSIRTCITYCRNNMYTSNVQSLIRHINISIDNAISLNTGSTPVEITKESITNIVKEEEIKDTILWALEEDKVEVFYQPIYSANYNRFTSAEALVRIRKEDGTVILPKNFIGVAEKKGLIEVLGNRVYEKVCLFMSDFGSKDHGINYISVNLSSYQIQNPQLADQYIEIANKYMIDPKTISFEISEEDIATSKGVAMDNINKFANAGFRIALDGFGKSESNLNSFLDFPTDTIKMNMKLVWEYFENRKIRSLVQTIVKIAHNLGLEVVAEGVETLGQLDSMAKEKIDFIQGYYFFKPMSEEEYKEFLMPNAFGQSDVNRKMISEVEVNI